MNISFLRHLNTNLIGFDLVNLYSTPIPSLQRTLLIQHYYFFFKYQQFLKKQYQQPKSKLNKEWNFIPLTRGVHGLGWVGFVPNLDLTWIIRVKENMAQNQTRWSGLIFQFGSRWFWVVSVGYRVSLPGTFLARSGEI